MKILGWSPSDSRILDPQVELLLFRFWVLGWGPRALSLDLEATKFPIPPSALLDSEPDDMKLRLGLGFLIQKP